VTLSLHATGFRNSSDTPKVTAPPATIVVESPPTGDEESDLGAAKEVDEALMVRHLE